MVIQKDVKLMQDMARPPVLSVYIRLIGLFHFGPNISCGLTNFPKSDSETSPSFNAASFSVVPSLCAVFAIVAAWNNGKLLSCYILLPKFLQAPIFFFY